MSGATVAVIAAQKIASGGGGQVASDTFTGTDGASLSANWTTNWGSFIINTNAAASNASGASCAAYWNANTLNDRQYAELVAVAQSNGQFIGPAVRMQTGTTASTRTYASAVWDSSNMYVSTFVNDAQNVIAGPITGPGVGVLVRIEADGTTLRVYFDGALGGRTYNSVTGLQTSGRAGLDGYSNGTGTRGDSWACGNL